MIMRALRARARMYVRVYVTTSRASRAARPRALCIVSSMIISRPIDQGHSKKHGVLSVALQQMGGQPEALGGAHPDRSPKCGRALDRNCCDKPRPHFLPRDVYQSQRQPFCESFPSLRRKNGHVVDVEAITALAQDMDLDVQCWRGLEIGNGMGESVPDHAPFFHGNERSPGVDDAQETGFVLMEERGVAKSLDLWRMDSWNCNLKKRRFIGPTGFTSSGETTRHDEFIRQSNDMTERRICGGYRRGFYISDQ